MSRGSRLRREAYLDWNATAPLRPQARAAITAAIAACGNPSSVHRWGRAARRRVEESRKSVARLVGAAPENVVFVSGGTEANHLALLGAGRRRVLVSAVEHNSVLDAVPDAERLPVDGDGVVRLDVLKDRLAPMLRGGGQERRRRAGTENVPGIAGFGGAARAAETGVYDEVRQLRDALETELLAAAPDAVVVGAGAPRLPNTSAIAMPGIPAETQVIALDLEGIMVSAGAACSSGKVGPSHVLAAMGLAPEIAAATIRISLGWDTTAADIECFVQAWKTLYRRRRGSIEEVRAA